MSSASGNGVPASQRLDSIDILRGFVMVVMVLDHVKGNLSNARFDSTDLTQTTPVYFLTRWITHICAPTFVFLAGTGAFLYGARGKTTREVSWFLLTRGLWLIVLELTAVRVSWFANIDYRITVGSVIWAIGWSMIVLAGLVFLPLSATGVFGMAMIAFHNLADPVQAAEWGRFDWLWKILHTGEAFPIAEGYIFAPAYPLIPWMGVMAAGYTLGALMLLDPGRRRRELFGLGVALTLTFLVLRAGNAYGDKTASKAGRPGPWTNYDDWWLTLFSFVNCQKYPPSLDFLLMTLGPALMLLSFFERDLGAVGRFLAVYGRVPLFFYIVHFFLIKALAIGLAYYRYGNADWLWGTTGSNEAPSDAGYELSVIYLIWIGLVFALYPVCSRYGALKRRSRSVWLSYL